MSDSTLDYNRPFVPPPEVGSFFWPILILILGISISAGYQIMVMQDQLNSLTQAVDQMDAKVKRAQYEKTKLYSLANDVLQLAATDPNARQIAVDFKIQQTPPPPTTESSPTNSPAATN